MAVTEGGGALVAEVVVLRTRQMSSVRLQEGREVPGGAVVGLEALPH